MDEIKNKRYPTDRIKLRALLEKKKQELNALEKEVEHIRRLAKQAEIAAIIMLAEKYGITADNMDEIMGRLISAPSSSVPDLSLPVIPLNPAVSEEEESIDDDDP